MRPEEPLHLSKEAFRELKEITRAEVGSELPDEEIREMGTRLLRLFSILVSEPKTTVSMPTLTDQESKALQYIETKIDDHKRNPSVRDIAQALGFKSPRSGLKVLQKLIKKGLVYRCEQGNLVMREKEPRRSSREEHNCYE